MYAPPFKCQKTSVPEWANEDIFVEHLAMYGIHSVLSNLEVSNISVTLHCLSAYIMTL